jgi:hypothetical protein
MLGSALGLIALGALLGLVAFAGSIWLVVVAFRKGGTLWGLLTLFVPFANLAFAVKFWPDARKPFLASFVPGLACGFCFFLAGGMAASAVSGEMARQAQENLRTAPASAQLEEPAAGGESEAALRVDETPSAVPFVLNAVTPPTLPKSEFDPETLTRDGYAPVPFAEAHRYVGRVAKLVTRDGRSHRGTITAARAGAIELEQYIGAGSIAVEFGPRETEKVLVEAR